MKIRAREDLDFFGALWMIGSFPICELAKDEVVKGLLDTIAWHVSHGMAFFISERDGELRQIGKLVMERRKL